MVITNFSIRHRVTVFVLLAAIALMGAVSYLTLPRESTPDIKVPIITVAVPYPEASPEDVMNGVTIPLERELKNLKGLDELSSVSVEGASVTTATFDPDVEIEDALQRVREKFDAAKVEFPEDVEEETIDELSFSEFPIMIVTLYGADLRVLQKIAEELQERIEDVPGVHNVTLSGARDPQIEIEIDPERLAAYKLPVNALIERLRGENTDISAGSVDTGAVKPAVRIPGAFKTAEDVNGLIVHEVDGRPVYLRDVATAKITQKDVTSYARRDGQPAISIAVEKRAGENIIVITDIVKEILRRAEPSYPAGVRHAVLIDQSQDIRNMVSDLENNILSGLILVLLVILIAMGLKNALFVASAIPLSMGMSFLALDFMGITLNMVVLFALILAQGMLVDNAIVIIENIHRHLNMGKSPVKAAMDAVSEVAWPIITSTATTVAAFAPMIFWPGIMGEFMSYLPVTVITTLICSLFVALVINPVLAAAFMRYRKPSEGPLTRRAYTLGETFLAAYEGTLRLALRLRKTTVLVCFGALAAALAVYAVVSPGVELFPDTEPRMAYVNITAPEGTSIQQTDELARIVESRLPPNQDIKGVETTVGGVGGVDPMASGADVPHVARLTIAFHEMEDRTGSPSAYLESLRPLVSDLPGAEFEIKEQSKGPPTGPPINIEISVDDETRLYEAATRVREIVATVPGVVDLRDDYRLGKPEFRIRVNRQQAALLGLSTQWIGNFVKMLINGRRIGGYDDQDDEERDIIVRLSDDRRNDPAVLDQIQISDASGNAIPLSTVCSWEFVGGPGSIRRKDGRRVVTVSSDVAKGYNANVLLGQIAERIGKEQGAMPEGFQARFTGERKDQDEAQSFLMKAFLIAVILISLILVTEFNSVLQSMIILASVVLSLIGVMFSLIVLHQPFGVIMTGVGIISLAGVVVNNAIVLIDYTNQLKREGMPVRDAVITAGRTRLRPVLLTAITTTLGLLPMAIGVSFDFRNFRFVVGGESSQWWAPLATAVMFGLILATALTLLFVPVVYLMTDNASRRWTAFFKRRLGDPEASHTDLPAPEAEKS